MSKRKSFFNRVFSKIRKTSTCWEWTGAKITSGYGMSWLDGKQIYAHRAMYEIFVGKIPDGLQIDHLCRNRACVNPDHLEAVTCKENILRGDLSQRSRTNHYNKKRLIASMDMSILKTTLIISHQI